MGEFSLLDSAGLIAIEGLKDALPLVNVREELLELVNIDRSRSVLVKDICKCGRKRERSVMSVRFTLLQFSKLDEPAAVSVDALEQRLPLVDVVEEVAELVHVYRHRAVAIEHLCHGIHFAVNST